MKLPFSIDRLKTMSERLQASADLIQSALKDAVAMERQSLVNYENFCIALKEHGFYLEIDDFSWRHKTNGACASVEALQDVCLLYPTLAGMALKIMVAGHGFDIVYTPASDGLSATVTIKAQPLLDHIASKL